MRNGQKPCNCVLCVSQADAECTQDEEELDEIGTTTTRTVAEVTRAFDGAASLGQKVRC